VCHRGDDRVRGGHAEPGREADASPVAGDRPTWAEFDEQPAADFEPRAPAEELATVLQRMRADLDRAGRASAEQRVDALRALAEQAVLAVELEKLLERHGPQFDDTALVHAYRALGQLKDRMLALVAEAGLEIVRLRGVAAGDVADVVEIDGWRCDDIDASPVVIAELEAAVRLGGATLRRGRVIMGGAGADATAASPQHRDGCDRPPAIAERIRPPSRRPPLPRIVCPIPDCRTENASGADVCVGCLTPLAGFGRLLLHPASLFNQGLRAAHQGDSGLARECFAAVALWLPYDITTRNAHALACLDAGDLAAARAAWTEVLQRSPGDRIALRGLAALSPPDGFPTT
jgi:hypothetical protein